MSFRTVALWVAYILLIWLTALSGYRTESVLDRIEKQNCEAVRLMIIDTRLMIPSDADISVDLEREVKAIVGRLDELCGAPVT